MDGFTLHLPNRAVPVAVEFISNRLTISDGDKIQLQVSGPWLTLLAEPEQMVGDRPEITDLTGDPANDWPLFVRRFHRSVPDVVTAIASYYKHLGRSVPGLEATLKGQAQLDQDVEIVLPVLAEILAGGQLKRGARSRIAEALGIKDAGNYRARIDAVIDELRTDNSNNLTVRKQPDAARKSKTAA